MPSRCFEFVDSRLRRSPPDRASAVPMDKLGKRNAFPPPCPQVGGCPQASQQPQQRCDNFVSGNDQPSSRLPAFSLFFPGSCPNNRDRRREPVPALWITALKRPSLLTCSATLFAPAMVEKSPEIAPLAPGAAAHASRQRWSFRPCKTTSWPCSIRSLAAIIPRPSDDPVTKTRAITLPPQNRRAPAC